MNRLPRDLERHQRTDPQQLAVDDTIFSQSNGVLGVRGTMAEGTGDESNDPYALINGFYTTVPYHYEENSVHFPQQGQTIVKLMSASSVTIHTDQGELSQKSAQLVDLKRFYVLSEGVTRREATYRFPSHQSLTITEERLVDQTDKYLVVSSLTIWSHDYQGSLTVLSHLAMPHVSLVASNDPRVQPSRAHLRLNQRRITADHAALDALTIGTGQKVTAAFSHLPRFEYTETQYGIDGTRVFRIEPQQSITFIIYQSYDTALTNPHSVSVEDLICQHLEFSVLKERQKAWAHAFWEMNPIFLSDPNRLLELQYAIYQLNGSGGELESLQIAAKGISGVGYEGHYFWDTEIYMLPYFILTQPEKAKRLLMYRILHREEARQEARKLGVSRGIKIPWRTINGEETSPYYPAGSAQIHINSDIAYTIMQYYAATLDHAFMIEYGDEMILETALFVLDYGIMVDGKFHLNTVTGPDEYTALVNDNYYTNAMAKRHFETVLELAERHSSMFDVICRRLGVQRSVLDEIRAAAEGMVLNHHENSLVIAQDDSFFRKKPLDLTSIPADHHPMLLHYHPLFIYRHQVLKQSDTVLAMVLLDRPVDETFRETFEYYLAHTTHDSSLSKCIYGIAAFALGQHQLGHEFFMDSLEIDLNDTTHHTQHGLHMANIGGTYLLLAYGLFGIRIGTRLKIAPRYQEAYTTVAMQIIYYGVRVSLEIDQSTLRIHTDQPMWVEVYEEPVFVQTTQEVLIKTP
jgi:alpha,alpha-trehalose phosphorylase